MKEKRIQIPLEHISLPPKPPFYFLSDIHISTRSAAAQDARKNDLLKFLEKIGKTGGTLFILGDFFDFWFDCRSYVPENLKPVLAGLTELIQADIEIHYIAGNHDYWIPGYLTEELGIHYYPEALDFEYRGLHFYCVHGDQFAYNHPIYPLIRKILHSKLAIAAFKCLPAPLIYFIAENISYYNRAVDAVPQIPEKILNDTLDFLLDKVQEAYDIVLCGHVHKALHRSYGEKHIAILGDWIRHRSYGIWDEQGFRLLQFNKKE